MRVLTVGNMYPPHHLGGYELMWKAVVDELRRQGHEVSVLTTDYSRAGAGPDEPGVVRSLQWYWRDHDFPKLSLRRRYRLERQNLATLRAEIDRFEPDVVSLWAMGGMSMSLVESVLRGSAPVVGVIHDDWMLYGPEVDQWHRTFGGAAAAVAEQLTRIPSRLALDSRATWVFNSEATRDAATARWDVDGDVVTPGVDLDLFQVADDHAWTGRLLVLGRIDSRKGIALAVEALQALPGCELRVVGAGDGQHLLELRSLTADLGLTDRVVFATCARDQVPAEIAAADALLFCVQWAEPWGLVPLEAMAVGTPVVASGRGGSAEFLRDGENSLVYAPADSPTALAQAVHRLAKEPDVRADVRRGGRETAQQHSQQRFAERMAAIHEEHAT